MNKYQEAWVNFSHKREEINGEIDNLYKMVLDLDTDTFNFNGLTSLEELVDRATPIKRIEPHKKNGEWELSFTCNCGKSLDKLNEFNFCPNCGQAIDWGEENE